MEQEGVSILNIMLENEFRAKQIAQTVLEQIPLLKNHS